MPLEKRDSLNLENIILKLRGENVILAPDLAAVFGVKTIAFNQAVKRNMKRFPPDFVFQLNQDEFHELITNCDRFATLKHSSHMPYAFTEHGAVMASMILNSPRAVEMSIYVVRAFTAMRRMTVSLKELADKVAELDRKYGKHDEMLHLLSQILFAEKSLSPAHEIPVPPKKRKIGFGNRKTSEIVS